MAILKAQGNTPAAHLRVRLASPYHMMRLWVNIFFVFSAFGFGAATVFTSVAIFNSFPKESQSFGPVIGALLISIVLVLMMIRQLSLILLDMVDLLIDAGLRSKMQAQDKPGTAVR